MKEDWQEWRKTRVLTESMLLYFRAFSVVCKDSGNITKSPKNIMTTLQPHSKKIFRWIFEYMNRTLTGNSGCQLSDRPSSRTFTSRSLSKLDSTETSWFATEEVATKMTGEWPAICKYRRFSKFLNKDRCKYIPWCTEGPPSRPNGVTVRKSNKGKSSDWTPRAYMIEYQCADVVSESWPWVPETMRFDTNQQGQHDQQGARALRSPQRLKIGESHASFSMVDREIYLS